MEEKLMPEEALVAELMEAVMPVESATRLTANAMAEVLVPEMNESSWTPWVPVISRVTEVVMAEALNRREAVWADWRTFMTTGMVACVPKAAVEMATSWRALVVTPELI